MGPVGDSLDPIAENDAMVMGFLLEVFHQSTSFFHESMATTGSSVCRCFCGNAWQVGNCGGFGRSTLI